MTKTMTKTITLPTDQWEIILAALWVAEDEGPSGSGWQSKKLSRACEALDCALQEAPQIAP